MYADVSLDNKMLKDILSKKLIRPSDLNVLPNLLKEHYVVNYPLKRSP